MAKPGDTGFTSSTGPTKVESNTKVDYEVNEKGEAHNRTDLAALSIGVRCCSVVCGGVVEKPARHSAYAFWDFEHAPHQHLQALLPGYSALVEHAYATCMIFAKTR